MAALPQAQLSEGLSFTFTDGQRGHMSREEMLAHIVTDGSNHRGAVGQIMKQLKLSLTARRVHRVFAQVGTGAARGRALGDSRRVGTCAHVL